MDSQIVLGGEALKVSAYDVLDASEGLGVAKFFTKLTSMLCSGHTTSSVPTSSITRAVVSVVALLMT